MGIKMPDLKDFLNIGLDRWREDIHCCNWRVLLYEFLYATFLKFTYFPFRDKPDKFFYVSTIQHFFNSNCLDRFHRLRPGKADFIQQISKEYLEVVYSRRIQDPGHDLPFLNGYLRCSGR